MNQPISKETSARATEIWKRKSSSPAPCKISKNVFVHSGF